MLFTDEDGEEEEEEVPHRGIIHAEEDEVIEESPADCFPNTFMYVFRFWLEMMRLPSGKDGLTCV